MIQGPARYKAVVEILKYQWLAIMALDKEEDTYVYLTSTGSLNYYSDNTSTRFKNAIKPIRFQTGVDYEDGVTNLLIPTLKSRILARNGI